MTSEIAVVTPSFRTPSSWLQQCVDSVACQTCPCVHYLVCDGDDLPSDMRLPPNVQVIRLPRAHDDSGNAARSIGSVSAVSRGAQAIAYLDADNWFEPNHVESLMRAALSRDAAVASSGRTLVDLDGGTLGACREVDGKHFVDTSCLLLRKEAFPLIATWYLMPKSLAPVCDRVFWKAVLDSGLSHVHMPDATLTFRTRYVAHYLQFGKSPPPDAKPTIAYSLSPLKTRGLS